MLVHHWGECWVEFGTSKRDINGKTRSFTGMKFTVEGIGAFVRQEIEAQAEFIRVQFRARVVATVCYNSEVLIVE